MEYPIIKEYGGVVNLANATLPKRGGKILIDLTSADTTASGLNKNIDRIARLVNLYGLAGITPNQLQLVVIVHGAATKTIMSDQAFQRKYRKNNPDVPVIEALREIGVKFMVCGQAVIARGFNVEDMGTDIELAISAITTLVEYQQNGYSVLYY
ncbi:MAG: DsrE family protein [Cyclobacteriaceae bacterium]